MLLVIEQRAGCVLCVTKMQADATLDVQPGKSSCAVSVDRDPSRGTKRGRWHILLTALRGMGSQPLPPHSMRHLASRFHVCGVHST